MNSGFIIAIIAMALSYSLLKELIISKRARKELESPENFGSVVELRQKAEQMLKRITTLEEIIFSDPRNKRN